MVCWPEDKNHHGQRAKQRKVSYHLEAREQREKGRALDVDVLYPLKFTLSDVLLPRVSIRGAISQTCIS